MKTICPNCQTSHNVSNNMLGRRAKCSTCESVFVVSFGSGVAVEDATHTPVVNDKMPDEWLEGHESESSAPSPVQTSKRLEVRSRKQRQQFIQIDEPKRPGLDTVSAFLRAMFILGVVASVAGFGGAAYAILQANLPAAMISGVSGLVFMFVAMLPLACAELLDLLRGIETGIYVLNENTMTAGESD